MIYETLISPALWLAGLGTTIAFGVFAVLKKSRRAKYVRRAAIAALLTLAIVPAIAVVPAGHRGVVYGLNGGVSTTERSEGVTLLLPWVQHLTPMSVRTQKVFSSEVYAQSSDLQEITVVTSVNYHVQPDLAAELYRSVGLDYEQTVIQPAMFQRTKLAVGQLLAEDFAVNRAQLADTIKEQLEDQLAPYGIVVEFVNIEDAIFDPAFITAVKEKVIADQEAEEQRRLIAAERAKKQQAILQAEGRASATRIEARAQAEANARIARTLSDALLRWKLLATWDGILPTTLIGTSDGVSFLVDGRPRPLP